MTAGRGRILYFDCFSGISGDMVLGALVDAGLPLAELKAALGSLAIDGCDVDARPVLRAGIAATKFIVREHGSAGERREATAPPNGPHEDHHSGIERAKDGGSSPHHGPGPGKAAGSHGHVHAHAHRSLSEIFKIIDRSALSAAGRDRAKALFRRLAEVEASIHQMPIDRVHLHEVGALDSIIDIVGSVFAIEWFGAGAVVCSPLNVGGGTVESAHGRFPVPAPATMRLLEGVPIYAGAVQQELVTPTGALIAAAYATSYGPIPAMSVERVGYGAGDRDFPDSPNVLRVLVGRTAESAGTGRVAVIECEIDDMNPQIFGVVMDRLYEAGALEVFYVPVQMKKNRPGTLVTVLAPPERRARLADLLFRETTTIGLRYHEAARECLDRETVEVETPLGGVRFKVARRDGRVINAAPEFEDLVRLASAAGVSIKDAQALALKAYRERP